MRKKIFAFLTMLNIGCAEGSLAGSFKDATIPLGESGKKLSVKLDPLKIDSATINAIATYSAKQAIQVNEDKLLGDIVAYQCGEVDPVYYRLLALANEEFLGGSTSPTVEVKKGDEVVLPACIPKPTIEISQKAVASQDSEWKYWEDADKAFEWSNSVDPATVEILSRILSKGSLTVTYDDRTGKFVGPSNEVIAFRTLFAALNENSSLVAGEIKAVPEVPARWISFEPVDHIVADEAALSEARETLASLSSTSEADAGDNFEHVVSLDASCVAAAPEENAINELSGILLDLKTALHKRRRDPERVKVRIVDSGIVAMGGAIVSAEKIVQPTINIGQTGAEFDPQSYAPLSAPNIDKIRDHGTKVASLILGGPDFADKVTQLDFDIRLIPTRIYEIEKEPQTFLGAPLAQPGNAGAIAVETKGRLKNERVIDTLDRDDFDILNLSLGRRDEMRFFAKRFGPAQQSLYVVAAGNHHLDLKDGDSAFYPASYGGDREGRDNLITVASIDGNGSLSSFSNFGIGVVDIAAPGCEVPSEGIDFVSNKSLPTTASGTSFSAPQVTFVASLLKAIYHDVPAKEIKIRILQSSDLTQQLADQVTDGRVLNARKALSVFWDVLETVDDNGDLNLRRGRITPTPKIEQFCTDLKLPGRSRLLKVRFGFDGKHLDTTKNLVYWIDSGRAFKSNVCTASVDKITFKQPRGQTQFETSKLRDLVLAWE